MGLFGKKEDKKEAAQANAFDPRSGVTLKAPTMKEWTLYEDYIQLGNDRYQIADIARVVNAEIPKNRLLQGVINIFPKSGGFKLLGYSFGQKEIAAQAVDYISQKITAALSPEEQAAKAEFDAFKAGKERRMRCNVCGNLFCYSYQDLLKNQELAKQAKNAAIRGALSTMATSQILGAQQQAEADRKLSQIKDFNHCPNCNSTDLKQLTDEEYKEALAAKNAPAAPAAAVSAADELKKFKELLDLGVISQEEFDAKKKQLLGL